MLIDQLPNQGDWLFRRRSFVPLVLLPFSALVMFQHDHYFAGSTTWELSWELFCLSVCLLGVFIRGLAQGYSGPGASGRNTRTQIAESLNTTGMYSICRHPLYLGNIVTVLGLAALTRSPLLVLATLFGYVLLYERISAAEERFLAVRFGDSYREWAGRVPSFLPRFSLWRKPEGTFSFRPALKSEIYSLTVIFAMFALLEAIEQSAIHREIQLNPVWTVPLEIILPIFLTLRYIRKRTRWLETES
ncbi:MAG: isoprenylcysteine carboxylmethyltransferase family protein [bacterium]|nr:isoprenylcysteine carboxylmethyltransferase family protein [bacterium]